MTLQDEANKLLITLNGHFPEHNLLNLEESLITIYQTGGQQTRRPLEYVQANVE